MQPLDMPSTLMWYPQATADALPPMMLETDPRLSCQHLEDHLASIMANDSQCPIYRYSNTLAYKPRCRKRETHLILRAGDLTLPVVSKVGVVDDVSSLWYQKGVIMELGHPLSLTGISPSERLAIAKQMIILVSKLHERGIIHGDIRPDKFVTGPGDHNLKVVGFSVARMRDDSDLSSWPPGIPSPEYASPSRRLSGRPPLDSDDDFALAVSIWALFAGESPPAGLFSSNEGHMPDLTKITDNELFCAVVDILEEGGLEVSQASAISRKMSLGMERSVSFPLSLWGADPDDTGERATLKPKPRFCPHCFELALANETEAIDNQAHRASRYNAASLGHYANQWLRGQEPLKQHDPEPVCSLFVKEDPPRAPDKAPAPALHINTKTCHLSKFESPPRSIMSNPTSGTTTIIRSNRSPGGRDRSTMLLRTPPSSLSESDECHESVKYASGTISLATQSESSGTQRTMSCWSESSFESHTEDHEVESERERKKRTSRTDRHLPSSLDLSD